jgi:rhamnosyltransferase
MIEHPLVLGKNIRCMVLMPYFNAPVFFRIQIESILSQLGDNDILMIGDDASTEAGKKIAREFAEKFPWKIVFVENSERVGVTANVFALISHALASSAEYFFLADQDDYWLPGRLEAGVRQLLGVREPLLNISATFITDHRLCVKSILTPVRPLSRAHYIFETPAPGMTFCFNRGLATGVVNWARGKDWPIHDNLIAAYASLCARVTYDDTPRILYVQHASNQLGFRTGIKRFVHRKKRVRDLLLLAAMRYRLAKEDFKMADRDILLHRFRESLLDDILLKFLVGVGYALQHRNRN